jgi:hypothetical protein
MIPTSLDAGGPAAARPIPDQEEILAVLKACAAN